MVSSKLAWRWSSCLYSVKSDGISSIRTWSIESSGQNCVGPIAVGRGTYIQQKISDWFVTKKYLQVTILLQSNDQQSHERKASMLMGHCSKNWPVLLEKWTGHPVISLKAVPQGLHLIKDTVFFLNHLISILQMVETVCVQFGSFTMQSFTLQYPTSAKKMWNAIKLL